MTECTFKQRNRQRAQWPLQWAGVLYVCMWETDRLRKIMLALWMGRGTDRPTSGARGHSHCASVGSVFESQLKQQHCDYTCPSRCSLNLPPLARCLWRPCCFCLFMSFSVFTFICLAFFFFFWYLMLFVTGHEGCLCLQEIADNLQQLWCAIIQQIHLLNDNGFVDKPIQLASETNGSSKRAASQTPGLSLFRSLSP